MDDTSRPIPPIPRSDSRYDAWMDQELSLASHLYRNDRSKEAMLRLYGAEPFVLLGSIGGDLGELDTVCMERITVCVSGVHCSAHQCMVSTFRCDVRRHAMPDVLAMVKQAHLKAVPAQEMSDKLLALGHEGRVISTVDNDMTRTRSRLAGMDLIDEQEWV